MGTDGTKNFWIDLLNFNGGSPQVKKQKCRKNLILIGLYVEQQAFFQ